MGKFKRVCVFCGSNSGHRKIFSDAALDLGRELVKRKLDLVYGGGSIGLMGLVSQTVHDGGCYVLGVIPEVLVPHEISGHAVGEVIVASDMHERKAEMARRADAFIALPGGYGTMEELLEMITWSQLGIHDKPVGLLNVDGYYDGLLSLFDKGVAEGFIKPTARNIVLSAKTAPELIQRMEVIRCVINQRHVTTGTERNFTLQLPLHSYFSPRSSYKKDPFLFCFFFSIVFILH